jgi:hypothetical protein
MAASPESMVRYCIMAGRPFFAEGVNELTKDRVAISGEEDTERLGRVTDS